MALMFGRFEIQGEISKSETATIYKALDTETSQIVALKTQDLGPLAEGAAAFVDTLIAEGERALHLTAQNIVRLHGAGEIDGQFCAAMEYVQGNSITTMLARKEGFSIWDLIDISRQVCAALEHAATHEVVHSSLEPDKILVQWDGLVKVLGYGISSMSLIAAESGDGLGRLMPYCSPEQIRGEPMDQRSNQFTLGTILYEMVTGRKAFDAEDPVVLVGQVENDMPAPPSKLNPKIRQSVSAVIMHALAKDPAERYSTAREFLADLERCKDEGKTAEAEPKRSGFKPKFDTQTRKAVAKKFVSAPSGEAPVAPRKAASVAVQMSVATFTRSSEPEASGNSGTRMLEPKDIPQTNAPADIEKTGTLLLAAASIEKRKTKPARAPAKPVTANSMAMAAAAAASSPAAPAAHAAPPVPKVPTPTAAPASFSDINELPPLKQPALAPPAAEPVQHNEVRPEQNSRKEEKPKLQAREAAQRAVREIATVPPRLVLFSILGAVVVILVISVSLFVHVHSEDDGSTAAPRTVKTLPAPPAATQSAPEPLHKPAQPAADSQPEVTVRHFDRHHTRAQALPVATPSPVVVTGDALIDSTPQGAQFQVDGKSDPSWVTPFTVMALSPGKHIISANKSGYTTEIRSVDVVGGNKASLVFRLAPMNALMVVNSTPAGANITIDGRPTGRVTPAQFAVEKGSHTILLKKQGFVDETTMADLSPGQNFQYGPSLKALGNAEAIHTVGKFKKIFGSGIGESTAGMGSVSIRTQPRGAQVVINQRVLDKMSPVDVMMGPGNYVIDITLTGFKPVHKLVNVEKGGKIAIDEVLERE